MYEFIKTQDEEVFAALAGEEERERTGLELIPSENYVSRPVREALGSVFTNKYSEGYPGRRYYGGQEYTDAIETIAIERAKKLFNCRFANVQPLSGAPANVARYFALLEPGETVLGRDLSGNDQRLALVPLQHLRQQLLALAVAVGEGRVEERAPLFDGEVERRQGLFVVRARPATHAPEAVPHFRHRPTQTAKRTCVHGGENT